MDDRPLALYRRFLWESKNISWVYTSALDRLFASRDRYFEECGMARHLLTDAQQQEMDELIVSATLAAESQVVRDAWGWTIRIPLKSWGLFCGVEPEGMVCARFSNLAPEAAKDPVGLFAVQRIAPDSPMRQSSLIPSDVTTRSLVEQYFEESEQLPARIAISGNEAVMALSMPNAEWDIVRGLPESDLMALFHELIREADIPAPEADASLSDKAREIKAKSGSLSVFPEKISLFPFTKSPCDDKMNLIINPIIKKVATREKIQQKKGSDTRSDMLQHQPSLCRVGV